MFFCDQLYERIHNHPTMIVIAKTPETPEAASILSLKQGYYFLIPGL